MKTTILLVVGLAVGGAGRACGQQAALPVDSTTHKITYSAVVQVPGASQAELYGRALRWLAKQPVSPPDQRTMDATSGTLAARVGLPFTARAVVGSMQCTLWRQVNITVKEGRAKYEFLDFEVQPYVASAAAPAPPTKAQLKLYPAEEYLDRSNGLYYDKKGQPKAYAGSILDAVAGQAGGQAASLKAALVKPNDF
ncbi:DUF4468 domain-containing protein [Hymenobacter cheonanensis]|uniref:DUF4468 domain-containing protein n=1 Tax=Hymenobacter sp. CA2-7 TaxID=3063993 RepID=UPI002713698A|nr:DUF4468 domain-containing protein [Hymenobacter sp. CA2-7]MDO7888167.1 DUF4468 domain-containing protein [Hymenobacter sp. CA2-7]